MNSFKIADLDVVHTPTQNRQVYNLTTTTPKASSDVEKPNNTPKKPFRHRLDKFISKPNWLIPFQVLIVPIAVSTLTCYAKKLVRRQRGFKATDFYFGVEFVLASISGCLTSLTDSGSDSDMIASLLLICILCLFHVISIHQDREGTNPESEIFWLVGVCNSIGIFLMILYLILVKI
jgi:hypothetical protein